MSNGRLVGVGRDWRGRIEDLLEALGGLLTDEIELKGPCLVLSHVLLSVILAEDVQLHVRQPDPALALADKPGSRLRLVRDCSNCQQLVYAK